MRIVSSLRSHLLNMALLTERYTNTGYQHDPPMRAKRKWPDSSAAFFGARKPEGEIREQVEFELV